MSKNPISTIFKDVVEPFLRLNGFTKFAPKRAWRYQDNDTIDVIEFQTFGTYLSDGVGCSTLSFAIQLGVYYLAVEKAPWCKMNKSKNMPREFECGVRGTLLKDINQSGLSHPWGEPSQKDRPDVWYVLEDKSNLDDILTRSVSLIEKSVFGWFDYFNDPINLLDNTKIAEFDEIENFFAPDDSFAHAELYSAIALDLGLTDIAVKEWGEIIRNPFYQKPGTAEWLKMANERLRICKKFSLKRLCTRSNDPDKDIAATAQKALAKLNGKASV